jgi:hypothetical protein
LENAIKRQKIIEGDNMFIINKGITPLMSFNVLNHNNQTDPKCEDLKKQETRGLANINKFYQKYPNEDKFEEFYAFDAYFVPFFKYPYSQTDPNTVRQYLFSKDKSLNLRISEYLRKLLEEPKDIMESCDNKHIINEKKKDTIEEFQNFQTKLNKFCKVNKLNEGI